MANGMNNVAQGLLGNPLFGMGIGLLSGAVPGGTFAGGAQAGLGNMMAMQQANRRNQIVETEQQMAQMQMAEARRRQEIEENMRAQGPSGLLGQPAVPGQTTPFEQDLFPGEQPAEGLLTQTTPGQEATGMYAQNPQMAGMLENYYQADPMGMTEAMGTGAIDQMFAPPDEGGGFTFADYMANPETRELYDQYKGRDVGGPEAPANIREWEAFNNMSDQDQQRYLELKRNPSYLDLGTSRLNPVTGQEYPVDLRGKAVEQDVGANIGSRLASYPNDMAVAEDLLSSLDETKNLLTDLSGLTDYTTAGAASWLNSIPMTDARTWNNLKTTIQAQLGLSRLAELKAASPSGASGFGALSERELDLLVSNLGKLDQADDPKEIKRIILSIQRQLGNKADRVSDRMGAQQEWYDRNKYRLEGPTTPEATGTPDAGTTTIDWNDLPP